MSGHENDLSEYEYGVLMVSIDKAYAAMGAPTEDQDPGARDPFYIGEAVTKALHLKDIQIRSLTASLEAARAVGRAVQAEADARHNQEKDSAATADMYREAIKRSGLDMSLCRSCNALVVCIPDGLSNWCEACAEKEASR